jgi:ATP-binding cassette subfamily B protein
VRENITYGLDEISDRRLHEALERANCTEFVRRLPNGIDTVIGSHGGKLSGGQRQRIAIARALLRDPKMLILDEATSALDAHAEHLVQAAINELIVGRTTIIIAHRLATLKSADRIVVLDQGRIVEQGTWLELLNRADSAFGKAYALQS